MAAAPEAEAATEPGGASAEITGGAAQRPAAALCGRDRGRGARAVGATSGDGMIGPGTGVRVYLACGVTDMRKGIAGLAALAQDQLRQKPTGGAVFAFRGRRGDG